MKTMKMLILNDQGGSVMDVSEDVTATLRAQDHGHPPVICFEPGIAKREGNSSRFVKNVCCTLRADMGDNQPAVCFEERAGCEGGGKGILVHEEMSGALRSAYVSKVCYAIEGNVVDRVSAKNGKGWCENVVPTLNTQDRHAVVFALEGNGARPSHLGKGFSDDGKMYTLNTIEQHSVCYGIDQQGGKSNCGYAEDVMPTLCSDSHGTPHAVCYAVDCRNLYLNTEISGTLQAKNEGGHSLNFLNPILRENI